jgi:hypothetical protein
VERKTRFELATLALARRCSTTEPLPHIFVMFSFRSLFLLACLFLLCGLSDSHEIFLISLLCLYHWATSAYNMVEGGGFEPPKAQLTDLQSVPFSHSGIPPLYGASEGNRTPNLLITNQLLYHWATLADFKCQIFDFIHCIWPTIDLFHKSG